MRIIRGSEVTRLTGLSATTLWRRERDGTFPRRVKIGSNSVGWVEEEVQAWIENRERGGPKPAGAQTQECPSTAM